MARFVMVVGLCGSLACGSNSGDPTASPADAATLADAAPHPTGELEWAISAGGLLGDAPGDVDLLTDGSPVVVGSFRDSAIFGAGEASETVLTSSGNADVFLARYDPSGRLVWAKRAGSSEGDFGSGVATFDDGSVVVTGVIRGDGTFDPGGPGETILPCSLRCGFAARYSADGALLWVSSDSAIEIVLDVAAAPDGASVLVGSRFVARYDSSGVQSWVKSIAATANSVDVLADGSSIVVGDFIGDVRFGAGEAGATVLSSPSSLDGFVARYRDDGTLDWAVATELADDISLGQAEAVAFAADGSSVVGGYVLSNDAGVSTSDALVMRYDADGARLWTTRIAAQSGSRADVEGVAIATDGAIVATGAISGAISFDPDGPNLVTDGQDGFVARYDSDGALEWKKQLSGPGADRGWRIAALPDGSSFVTGELFGTLVLGANEPRELELLSAGERDVFVARFAR